jgi:hypothetical protein
MQAKRQEVINKLLTGVALSPDNNYCPQQLTSTTTLVHNKCNRKDSPIKKKSQACKQKAKKFSTSYQHT